MTKAPDPIIMYDAPEAATYRTDIRGWVDRQGFYCGDLPHSEHQARWSGATHRKCETCANTYPVRAYCETCREKQVRERWLAMPIVEWDGEQMLCTYDNDRFFSDPDDFLEWCADEGADPGSVMLVATHGVNLREVDPDHWSDELPEDGELPDDVAAALDALNAVIRARAGKTPYCWQPISERIVIATPADWPKADEGAES